MANLNSETNNFEIMTRVPRTGRPKCKIRANPFGSVNTNGEFVPACLDEEAFWIGFNKFDHPWVVLTDMREYKFYRDSLERFRSSFNGELLSKSETIREIDLDKSCGYPWDQKFGPTKLDALSGACGIPKDELRIIIRDPSNHRHKEVCEFLFDYFLDYYMTHDSIFSTTLKDEIRPDGKEARFFTPAPLEMVIVGNWLFANSIESVVKAADELSSPITVGLTMPGVGSESVWQTLSRAEEKGARIHDFDGSAWDANCNMSLLMAIRDFRISLNPEAAFLISDYYNRAYCRFCRLYTGEVVIMHGMPSGHTLTSVDNSLVHACVMKSFDDDVAFYCNGDDLIVSMFCANRVSEIVASYARLGMYLETSTFDDKKLLDCSYLGMYPLRKRDNGVIEYAVRPKKLISSFQWSVVGRRPVDIMAKNVSLCSFLYGTEYYHVFRERIINWTHKMLEDGLLSQDDPAVDAHLDILSDEFQEFLHGYGIRLTSSAIKKFRDAAG